MPNGAPNADIVLCVWMASSRVGATTRTVGVDLLGSEGEEQMRRAMAGMPNARVLPLLGEVNIISAKVIKVVPSCFCNANNIAAL